MSTSALHSYLRADNGILFGELTVGDSVVKPLTISIQSPDPTKVLTIGISVPSTAQFKIPYDTTVYYDLRPGRPITLPVIYKPLAAGSHDATIQITFTDASIIPTSPISVALHGDASAEKVIYIEPAVLDFGITQIDQPVYRKFSLSNASISGSAITVSWSAGAAPFIYGDAVSEEIEPGDILGPIEIMFMPEGVGTFDVDLQITHDSSNVPSPFTVHLHGQAVNEFSFQTESYTLKRDQSQIRLTLYIEHNGPINNYDGSLEPHGVFLIDPGESEVSFDPQEWIAQPTAEKFSLLDRGLYLSKILLEDANTNPLVGILLERDTGSGWETECNGNIQIDSIEIETSAKGRLLNFSIKPPTYLWKDFTVEDACASIPRTFGDTRRGRGLSPIISRLFQLPHYDFPTSDSLLNLFDFLGYLFNVQQAAGDARVASRSAFALDLDYDYLFRDAPDSNWSLDHLNMKASEFRAATDDWQMTLGEFYRSFAATFGFFAYVRDANRATIVRFLRDKTSTAELSDNLIGDIREAYKTPPADNIAGTWKIGGGNTDVRFLNDQVLDPLTGDEYWDRIRQKDGTFDMVGFYGGAGCYRGDNGSSISGMNGPDSSQWLTPALAINLFYMHYKMNPAFGRVFTFSLEGIDYNYTDVLLLKGAKYFPIRMKRRRKEGVTEFDAIPISAIPYAIAPSTPQAAKPQTKSVKGKRIIAELASIGIGVEYDDDGNAVFLSQYVKGGLIARPGSSLDGTYVTNGSLPAEKLKNSLKRFTTTVKFSASSDTQVSWIAGTLTPLKSTAVSINAGSVSNLASALTYIYWSDQDIHTLHTTANPDTVNDDSVIIVATCRAAAFQGLGAVVVPLIGTDAADAVFNALHTNYLTTIEIEATFAAIDWVQAGYVGVGGSAGDVNGHSTQISPGKILIYGDTNLEDWRAGADATKIDGGKLYTGTVISSALNFIPVESTNVVAKINASEEGIRIEGSKIVLDGTVQFGSGYDPSTKTTSDDVTTIIGGTVDTEFVNALAVNARRLVSGGGGGKVEINEYGIEITGSRGQYPAKIEAGDQADLYLFAPVYCMVGSTAYLMWHQGNDGSNSGLDADLLDGSHASGFASASHNHAGVYAPVSHAHGGGDITSGTISDSYLPSSMAGKAFTSSCTIYGNNVLTTSSSLNASNLASGTVPMAQLPVSAWGSASLDNNLTNLAEENIYRRALTIDGVSIHVLTVD